MLVNYQQLCLKWGGRKPYGLLHLLVSMTEILQWILTHHKRYMEMCIDLLYRADRSSLQHTTVCRLFCQMFYIYHLKLDCLASCFSHSRYFCDDCIHLQTIRILPAQDTHELNLAPTFGNQGGEFGVDGGMFSSFFQSRGITIIFHKLLTWLSNHIPYRMANL